MNASLTCFGSSKKGHIQHNCQADKNARSLHIRMRNMKVLASEAEVTLNGTTCSKKDDITVRLLINKMLLDMDTGAAVSAISLRQQQQLFPSLKL